MTDETLSRQPVTCTEHGKILPHFGCTESESWLDKRLHCQECHDVAHDEMDEREQCDAHQEDAG